MSMGVKMVKEETLRLWNDLVVAVGATKPKNNDMDHINNTWCPDGTLNAIFLRELRPELKEILSKSISCQLSKEGYKTQIITTIEFERLMNEVHQNVEQVDEKELIKWSRYNVSGVKKEMWSNIGSESKNLLIVSLSRYFDFEKKMDELNNKMRIWIKGYKSNLSDLEELAEANPDLALEKHIEQLDLSKKRLNDVVKIRKKLPEIIDDPIHGLKNKMRQEIFNAIFSGSIISEIPDWASEIDAVKTGQNMVIMNKFLELDVESPRNEIDKLLSELGKIMNGPVEERLNKLSKISLTE